jgi:hypothetical protein
MPEITLAGYDATWLGNTALAVVLGVIIIVVGAVVLEKVDVISYNAREWLAFWPVIFGVVALIVLGLVGDSIALTHDKEERMRAILSEGFLYPDIDTGQYFAETPEGDRVSIEFMKLYGEQWTYKVAPVE